EAPVRAEHRVGDRVAVGRKRRDDALLAHVPHPRVAVVASGDEQAPVAAEGGTASDATLSVEDRVDATGSPVPESDRPVVSRQGKEPATWIPRRAVEAERLLYMGKPFTALPPPDDRLARRSRGGEQLAAGGKRRPEDLAARVERGDFRAPAGGRVPFPDPRVAALTRAHDTAAVGGEGNALKGLAVSVEDRPGERNCKGELQRLRLLAPLRVVRMTGLDAPDRDPG